VKIYCAVASGVSYIDGKVELKGNNLYFYATEFCPGDIAFELVPWQLNYEVEFDEECAVENCYFLDTKAKLLAK